MKPLIAFLALLSAANSSLFSAPGDPGAKLAGGAVDLIVMGNAKSEEAHEITARFPPPVQAQRTNVPPPSDPSQSPPSDVIQGALGEPARRLLPRTPAADMYGGELDFTMKVDPRNQNYFTIKLWGSDSSDDGELILNCEGFEIGNRHGNGAADMLVHHGGPWFPGRFWYRTATLPLKLTKGKTSVHLQLRSAGKLYDYAGAHAPYIPNYQHLMKNPSWQIYRVYTHVGGYLDPAGEVEGAAPAPPVRPGPGPEVVEAWKNAVSGRAEGLLKSKALSPPDIQYLAECYGVPWTSAYQKKAAVDAVVRGIDSICKAYAQDHNDPANQAKYHNSAWGGSYSFLGVAISLLYPEMKDLMAEPVDFGGDLGTLPRKQGWSRALRASVDFGRTNRRALSNQEIDCSFHIYAANKGLLLVDPANALSEKEALRYPYEAAGLLPFLGNDQPGSGPVPIRGTALNNHLWYGPNWFDCTSKGTTKEPSFVGSDYGETGGQIYELGRLADDRKLMDRGLEMIRARAHFRFPTVDAGGFRVMSASEPIGARNNFLPGHDAYLNRGNGAAVIAHEQNVPDLDGWFQEQEADNQLYAMTAGAGTATTSAGISLSRAAGGDGAAYEPGDIAAAQAKPKTGILLPTAPGAPDFAWGDEENMVVAAKHGTELFFTNMVWRGNLSIEKVAMVFMVTPTVATRAEVQLDDIRYVPTGKYETRGGGVDSFPGRNPPDNKQYPNAETGNRYPIAVRPDLKEQPPEKNQDGGRGTGYTLCYGHWLAGMNGNYTTGDYRMKLPPGFASGKDLISGKVLVAPVVIPKGTTVVFYLPAPASIPTSPDTTAEN